MIDLRTGRWRTGAALASVALLMLPGSLAASDSLQTKINEIVQAEIDLDLFSGTVVVADHGKVIYSRAVGLADRENRVPNTMETRFNISSVQKTFIATTAMQLMQSGLLSLNDPLTRFFPDCPYATADRIQVQHLLNHSSGLADYRDSEEYRTNCEEYRAIEDVLPLLYRLEPAFEPGKRMAYSNAGVLYLKAIIERVTGQSLAENLTTRFFEPLQMDNTALYAGGDTLPDRAIGHERSEVGENWEPATGEPSRYAGGGIYTTGRDLLRFDQALYGEDLLDAKHRKIMFTPVGPQPAVALGWFVVPYGGTNVVMHSGGSGGFSTEFRRYPEKGYTIVVNSNYGGGAGFDITNCIEALLLGLPYEITSERTLWHQRGMRHQNAEEYREALEYFEKCVQGADPYLPALYQAGRTRLLGEFDHARALELFDRYIELAPANAVPSIAAAWWRKGVAYEQLGDHTRAVASYRKSLEADPAFGQAREALERLGED